MLTVSPVHIETEEFSDVRFKQRAVIEFLTAEKVPPIEIHRRMQAVLWWSVYWCEYSKTLGNAVQRWKIGASRFEWQNTKDGFQKLVQSWWKGIEVHGDFVEN